MHKNVPSLSRLLLVLTFLMAVVHVSASISNTSWWYADAVDVVCDSVSDNAYKSLWNEVYKHAKADMPRSQMQVLQRIMERARGEKNYGQLLTAQLMNAALIVSISPDSLTTVVSQLKKEEQKAADSDAALAAVYRTVLSRLLFSRHLEPDTADMMAKKAMENKDLLAAKSALDWQPFLLRGSDGSIFGDDMLSVVGFATGNAKAVHEYYLGTDNRKAQLVSALMMLGTRSGSHARNHDDDIRRLDSLMACYADLSECCELAVERLRLMKDASYTPKQQVEYIDEAMQKWGSWKNATTLQNMREQLTCPHYNVDFGLRNITPNDTLTLHFSQVRNPGVLTAHVSRVDIPQGTTKYKMAHEELLEHIIQKDVLTKQVGPRGVQPYEFYDTTMVMDKLPVGIYLVEILSDQPEMEPVYEIVHVSRVRLLALNLPGDRYRLAVVDAISGQPLPHAKIDVVTDNGQRTTLNTNSAGETTWKGNMNSQEFKGLEAYTPDDKASAPVSNRGYSYWASRKTKKELIASCFTDRAIYRPGQTVNLAILVMSNLQNRKFKPYTGVVEVTINDPAYDELVDTMLVVDEFGTAYMQLPIPANGLLGEYEVEVLGEDDLARCTFRVEEYKRPTFDVELSPLEAEDVHDSEVVVRGKATTFSGAPVSGAMVVVDVSRSLNAIRWLSDYRNTQVLSDTVSTDEKGAFQIHVPIREPESILTHDESLTARWVYDIHTSVTDRAGETHEKSLQVNHAMRPYSLSVTSLPSQVRPGQTLRFKPVVVDRWGLPADKTVLVWTDHSADTLQQEANKMMELPVTSTLAALGIHHLHVKAADQVNDYELKVVDFSANRLGVYARDFFAQSASSFPSDGGMVNIQLGSSLDSVHVLYTVFSENKVVESGTFELSDAIHNRSFAYKRSYGKGLTLSYVFVKDGQVITHNATILAPVPDKSLKMEWTTFRDRLQPGQQETWTLRVRHADGSPAKAQLLSTLYDASLDPITRHQWSFSPFLPYSMSLYPQYWCYDRQTLRSSSLARHQTREIYPLSLNTFDDQLLRLRGDSTVLHRILAMAKKPSEGWMRGVTGFVSGIVIDEEGEPIIGASVRVDGSKEGTVTDFNGLFSLPVSGGVKLSIMFVGYEEQVVRAFSGNYLEVRLTPSWNALDEVVVVGYGMQKKANMTGAVLGEIVSGVKVRGATSAAESFGSLTASLTLQPAIVRENFEETAFFYPRLMADDKGEFAISFTLPESITSWRFMGLAHDREMNFGYSEALAVAQKEVMVQPNLPRFIRVGDESVFSARIANLSDKAKEGVAELTLSDINTGVTVWTGKHPFHVGAGTTEGVDFTVPSFKETAALVCRTVVSGDGFSDGEQQMIPVVPAREMVTGACPFIVKGRQKLEIPLDRLLPADADQRRLTFEYTAHPEWLAVSALPVLSATTDDDAVSLAAVYYANQLGAMLTEGSPTIRQAVMAWQSDTTLQSPLNSELQKNASLKELLLSETPWMVAADGERAMKHSLATFFDTRTMNKKCEHALYQLRKLQNADGGWAWCQGLGSSVYTSVMVMEIMARMQMLKPSKDCTRLLDKGMTFLQNRAREKVEKMRKDEEKGLHVSPDEWLLHYLYISELVSPRRHAAGSEDVEYLLSFLRHRKLDLSIYGKAVCAVIMAREGDNERAQEYLKSLKEYAVVSEEMGMYFDTPKALRSWYNYEIPTVAMAIEATQMLTPEDTTSIRLMRQWLLMQKRTQMWESNVATTEAIYALFNDVKPTFSPFSTSDLTLMVDGVPVSLDNATAGVGFVSTQIDHGALRQVAIENHTGQLAWGACFGQSLQKVDKVASDAQGLSVERELVLPDRPLRVGDKITVRITVKADRNYDFVQVCDRRPACLEPVNALSDCHWDYYSAKKDNVTTYFFDQLAKGVRVLEEEYYVDREGKYTSGTCVVQCAYAPEFKGVDGAYQLNVSR